MERPIGKCFFCGREVFTRDVKRDSPTVVQFPFQGIMRYGCLAHPGVEDIFRGKQPNPPPKRK